MNVIEISKGAEQQKPQKQWIQIEKISTLADLMPALVHKLNNPLASVIGYAQLILPRIDDPETKKDLEKIVAEAQRASQIIKSLVTFTKKRKTKKEAINLNEIIEAVLEKKTIELNLRSINVVKELSSSLSPTQVDPKQIEQVLINLINNAEEAISEFHGLGEIRVKTKLMDDHIEIMISDDGPGIPKENLSNIFDPLFTTKGTGIGLGLPISNDILAEHNGTMRVETEWGRGATFTITLPMIKGESKKKVAEEIYTGKSLKGMKGLVIDDDPILLNFIYKYLELEGCEMTTAPDAQTALGILEVKDYDFVICDMKMPGMNGSDFYRIVKKRNPSLSDRIIFSTGDVLSETTKEFIDSVINPCIEKPFTLTDLKKAIALHTGALARKVRKS